MASVSNKLMSLVTTIIPLSLFILKMKLLGEITLSFLLVNRRDCSERLQTYTFELKSVLEGPRLTIAVHATAFAETITLHSPVL